MEEKERLVINVLASSLLHPHLPLILTPPTIQCPVIRLAKNLEREGGALSLCNMGQKLAQEVNCQVNFDSHLKV